MCFFLGAIKDDSLQFLSLCLKVYSFDSSVYFYHLRCNCYVQHECYTLCIAGFLSNAGILDEDMDDILINVNIVDDEHAKKNVDNKSKRPNYKPYDEAAQDDYGTVSVNWCDFLFVS